MVLSYRCALCNATTMRVSTLVPSFVTRLATLSDSDSRVLKLRQASSAEIRRAYASLARCHALTYTIGAHGVVWLEVA